MVDYLLMIGCSAITSGMTAGIFSTFSNQINFFKNSNYILNNFLKFSTDYGGITLRSSVLLQVAAQISIREALGSVINSPFNSFSDFFFYFLKFNNLSHD